MKGIEKAGFDAGGSPPGFSRAFPVACSFSGAGFNFPIGSSCGAGITIPMEIGFGAGIIPIGSRIGAGIATPSRAHREGK